MPIALKFKSIYNIFPAIAKALFLSFFLSGSLTAQGDSEVYLMPLTIEAGSVQIGEETNISQNPGYDNQPYFPDDDHLLYARTRNGQTDIALRDLQSESLRWLTDTPEGSEYSPAPVPGASEYSAVRLDTNGLQRLYAYPESGGPRVLVPNEKVGYYLWIDAGTVACTILEADRMDLVMADLAAGRVYKYQKGVGRCLQRIPGGDRFSYTSFRQGQWLLKSMDPRSGATSEITRMPPGVQDYCWLPDGSLLCAARGQLWRQLPGPNTDWEPIHSLPREWGAVTRLAVNPSGTRLAVVAETIEAP